MKEIVKNYKSIDYIIIIDEWSKKIKASARVYTKYHLNDSNLFDPMKI
jgi:hypothetical protein